MTTSEGVQNVSLYGGALSMSLPIVRQDKPTVPFQFMDMSQFRQVPDHQEVYSDLATGCAVIVELLGLADNVANDTCASYYFEDLAKCNGCEIGQSATLSATATLGDSEIPKFPSNNSSGIPCEVLYKCSAEGYQRISKFVNEETKPNEVYVGIVIIRLGEPVSTDLVISVSAPLKIHPESSEAKNVTPNTILTLEEAQRILKIVSSTLVVDRWSLFV